MSTPKTTDPVYFHDSYFIRGKDHQGNERYYRMRLFEVYTNADGTKTRKQISLTLNEWQHQANLVQQAATAFFAKPIELPTSFKIEMQDRWKLTPSGHPEETADLLNGASEDRVIGFNRDFRSTIVYPQYTAALLPPPPPLPADMLEDDALDINAILGAAPAGIRNVTHKDCFISAFLQAFVFTNPELMRRLWERRENGKEAEIGRFLYRYSQAQNQRPQPNGEEPLVDGVHELRRAIVRSNETTGDFLTGAHDSIEAFAFIANLLAAPIEQKDLVMKGYIQVAPKDNDSLEQCMLRSLAEHPPKQDLPNHAMVVNNTKDPFASVVGSSCDYDLTSFIQHTPADGGHYIAYVQRNGIYYKCNDSSIERIEQAKFLEEAKTARAALYTRTR